MRFKLFYDAIVIILISIVAIFLSLEEYELTHVSFSLLLLFLLITRKSLNTKIFLLFLFFYYFIPFWNISTYRGTISFETLKLYTYGNFALIAPLIFTFGKGFFKSKEKAYSKIHITPLIIKMISTHLLVVYAILGYVYLTVGNILLYQELRFFLSPTLSYLIKSTLYIPIFILFLEKSEFSKKNILLFIILPLIPPFFIGSRGTVVIIVISILLLYLLKNFPPGERYYLQNSTVWKKNKYRVYFSGGLVLLLIQITYYTRRMFSDQFLSTHDLALRYFGNTNWYNILILPIYFSFRETVGITSKIIERGATNIWFDYPMFFSEVYTLLPGVQASPGIKLSKELYKNSEYDGGITPGIIGGLYLDYKYWLILILFCTSFFIYVLYKKSLLSDTYKILYAITLTQFFHLYHRGFFKPEYLVAYVIILFYIFIASYKMKSADKFQSNA